MSDQDDIIKEFLQESHENLDRLDRDLVALEQNPHDRDRLASIFRTIHTIKGTCGFFGFAKLEAVTHVGENLLSLLRDGRLTLTAERTTALLALVDAVRAMLAQVAGTGQDGEQEYSELIQTLTRLQADAPAAAPAPDAPAAGAAAEPPRRRRARRGKAAAEAGPAPPPPPEAKQQAPAELPMPVAESSIRVDVGLLDRLMNLVGELVLTRNQILQFNATNPDPAFQRPAQRLNLITSELQEGVMKTRMQPIGNIWSKFPRVVRDLAVLCGKQVRVELEGQETELDKTLIEAIKDPLTHLIRNAVDHGVEPPEARVARGKPAEGRLSLRAYHEGGQVNIEIGDDGGGIDPGRVKNKALERGLIAPEQAARLGERDLLQLIFLPGFSTAEAVTSVSGRGVGMDVVKTNIERIGGTVDLESQRGRGTTVKVKIPLTLAIVPALVVTCGGDRYAIPQASLVELVRLDGDQARTGVEYIHGAPVHRLRGRLLPLVNLHDELGVESAADPDALHVVVLRADGRPFGLVVDGINDTEEIVVKPLGKLLKGIPLYAGATIMGDGRVALILDVFGIAQRARVVTGVRERAAPDRPGEAGGAGPGCQALLVVGHGPARRLAIPLSSVARLEEIPASAVEYAEGQEVVQYRGDVLPLLRLANYLPGGDAEQDPLPVVVYRAGGRGVGLVVGRILDIVEAEAAVLRPGRGLGVRGAAVIQGRVTDLLDIPALLRAADPAFFEEPVGGASR